MSDDLEETISDAAAEPAAASGDAGSVTQRPLPDLIDADRYLAGKRAKDKPHGGIRFGTFTAPGSV